MYASRILGLLRAVSGDGERADIITVATGEACSAAADFLAQGDYVMAFRHASLLFHGTRMAHPEITRRRAEWLEQDLEREDRAAASRLALGVFDRFLRLYLALKEQVEHTREAGGMYADEYADLVGKGTLDLPSLVFVLCNNVGDDARDLLMRALNEMRRIKGVLAVYKGFVENKVDSAIFSLLAPSIKGERKKSRMQLRVLEAVIASRLVEDEQWDLRAKSFQDIEADFLQVSGLAEGTFEDDLLDLLLKYEDLFFNAGDQAKIARMRATMTVDEFDGNKKAKAQFDAAVGRAYSRAEPLWQYVSTLCRLLNEGENEVGSEDAWHMGLIDEVVGYPLAHRERGIREAGAIQRSLSFKDTQKFV